jgi:dTDP-4-amino-4,6-dideoxy-D-galactose acyltransferase
MKLACELLDWDSDFFGCRIARVVGGQLNESGAREALDWCRHQRIDCLYFLTDAADLESIAAAENHGFGLKDVRVTYKRRLSLIANEPLVAPPSVHMRAARLDDLEALEPLCEGSYTESRFYSDRRFSKQSVSLMYKIWVRKSVQGAADWVWVLEWNKRPAGFITCHLSGDRTGQVQLTALHPDLRGKGIGRHLYETALRWFADQGVETVIYVTQARNIPAQRLIQRLGFLSDSTQLWYHKWIDSSVETAA